MTAHVLVTAEDSDQLDGLSTRLRAFGYVINEATTAKDVLRVLGEQPIDVVLLDAELSGCDGLALLTEIVSSSEAPSVLMIAKDANVQLAVEAMQQGADNFLEMPIEGDLLEQALQSTLRNRIRPQAANTQAVKLGDALIGHSREMRRVFTQIERIANAAKATTLIHGEPGTGKSLTATVIHTLSARSDQPFLSINCAAQRSELLEAELFGFEAGVDAPASNGKLGLFAEAEGGTLFLEQVDELAPDLQAKLGRVLKEGCYRRVGSLEDVPTDVRLLSATHRDLEQAVSKGEFREDLFYRLNVLSIRIPALRDRGEDIPFLATALLEEFRIEFEREIEGFSESAMQRLVTHAWPGNVRELRNTIERCVLMHESGCIQTGHLGLASGFTPSEPVEELDLSLEAVEKAHITKVIRGTDGNRSQAARLLGVNRTTLYNKLRRYGISAGAQ
ncbi:MAG: DNA-binding NtrC family response regulator [Planctomycetota bacterium]|jgi:DNA-binding NtrC family response regulator